MLAMHLIALLLAILGAATLRAGLYTILDGYEKQGLALMGVGASLMFAAIVLVS